MIWVMLGRLRHKYSVQLLFVTFSLEHWSVTKTHKLRFHSRFVSKYIARMLDNSSSSVAQLNEKWYKSRHEPKQISNYCDHFWFNTCAGKLWYESRAPFQMRWPLFTFALLRMLTRSFRLKLLAIVIRENLEWIKIQRNVSVPWQHMWNNTLCLRSFAYYESLLWQTDTLSIEFLQWKLLVCASVSYCLYMNEHIGRQIGGHVLVKLHDSIKTCRHTQ